MAVYKRVGGAWVSTTVKRHTGGAFANATSVKRREGGAWIECLAAALSAYLSPASINTSRANGSGSYGMTAVPSGGSGTRTYAWAWASGGAGMTLSNTTSAVVNIAATGTNVLRSGTIRCTVTDSVNGQVSAPTGTVDIQFGTPL